MDSLSQAVGCELVAVLTALFSQSSTISFVLFLHIPSANVTASNPRVFSLEKKKISHGLSISPAQTGLQDVAESCSLLQLPGLDLVESS